MRSRPSGKHLKHIALGIAALALVAAVAGYARWRADRRPFFVDVTEAAGIRFRHNNGAFGKKYMPETTGSGCAFFDYNNDGWLDILVINGKDFPEQEKERSSPALYRNNRNGTFTDATKEAGINLHVYGMGCAVGDYDNDGWLDVYITCLGPNHLLRNVAGKFRDVTKSAGVRGKPMEPGGLEWKWSSSVAWVDYDRDGWLDLFVGNYVGWTPHVDVWCGYGNTKGYCPPDAYLPMPNVLYRNNGDGTFTDVSERTGIARHKGKCWGVAVCDFDDDGFPDIAIANDIWQNFLFRNRSGQKFEEVGLEAGIAFGEMGKTKAGMGIDVADFQNDGMFAILVGNFSSEGLSLFRQEGKNTLLFTDVAHRAGLGAPSLPFLTFGLFFFDYDLDGWKDAFCANGHIDDIVSMYERNVTYAERPLLFRNEGGKKFAEVGLQSGAPLTRSYVLRGCAYGDYDNDGDLDVFVVSNNRNVNQGRALLWRNEGGNHNHWIRFALRGSPSNRFGFGAKVQVTAGDTTMTDLLRSGSSFLSQSEPLLTFGLGSRRTAERVVITWPSGHRQELRSLSANQTYEIQEKGGAVPRRPPTKGH